MLKISHENHDLHLLRKAFNYLSLIYTDKKKSSVNQNVRKFMKTGTKLNRFLQIFVLVLTIYKRSTSNGKLENERDSRRSTGRHRFKIIKLNI